MTLRILELLSLPIAGHVTATLLHFVWQGTAIALVTAIILRWIPAGWVRARYRVELGALLTMAVAPGITFALLPETPKALLGQALETPGLRSGKLATDGLATDGLGTDSQPLAGRAARGSEGVLSVSPSPEVPGWIRLAQPTLLALWLAGVVLFGFRLLVGMGSVWWLGHSRMPLPTELMERLRPVAQRMRISAPQRVFAGNRVREAIAIGFWRPLVLVPAAWVAEMPTEVLEAIIAHELAHIRRRDLLVNLLQRTVEALLFYHPAVWWLSRRMRLDREFCCDDLAVAATGDRVGYVRALELVARQRIHAAGPVLAAAIRGEAEMNLLSRVRHVLQLPSAPKRIAWWPGLLLLLAPILILTVTMRPTLSQDDRDIQRRDRPRRPDAPARGPEDPASRPRGAGKGDRRRVVDELLEMRRQIDRKLAELDSPPPADHGPNAAPQWGIPDRSPDRRRAGFSPDAEDRLIGREEIPTRESFRDDRLERNHEVRLRGEMPDVLAELRDAVVQLRREVEQLRRERVESNRLLRGADRQDRRAVENRTRRGSRRDSVPDERSPNANERSPDGDERSPDAAEMEIDNLDVEVESDSTVEHEPESERADHDGDDHDEAVDGIGIGSAIARIVDVLLLRDDHDEAVNHDEAVDHDDDGGDEDDADGDDHDGDEDGKKHEDHDEDRAEAPGSEGL